MIHANIICRVERYDPQTGNGELEPLFLDEGGNPLPKIVNARAVRHRLKLPAHLTLKGGTVNHSSIPDGGTSHTVNGGNLVVEYDETATQDVEVFPHYQRGDIVLAVIPDWDMSDAIAGRKGNGGAREAHELTSAIIVGLVGGAS